MPKISYTKRADGRLQTKMYVGTEYGKPIYKYIYARTYKELESKYNEVKARQNKGLDIMSDKDTFGYWSQIWLRSKKAEVSDKWYNVLKTDINKLDKLFGEPVTKMRQYMLKDILNELADNGYSQKTLKTVKDIASGVMQMAADERVVDYNVFASIKIPKTQKQSTVSVNSELAHFDRRALSNAEQQWVLNTPHRAQTAAMIMMYAGLRRGELIPLLWSDIDLDVGTISVNKSVERVNNKLAVKSGGKTKSASRTVYIPKILADYLRTQEHNSLFVCTNTRGKMLSESAWARMWESYLITLDKQYGVPKDKHTIKTLSIPRITPHWLRHTFISLMYLAGVDVLTAKEQAGHSDISTTLAIYTHLDEQYKHKNISKMDEYISKIG